MKFSEGGFSWGDILGLDDLDFLEAIKAAEDLGERLKRK